MPSRTWNAALGLLVALVFAYSVVIASQPLFGVVVGTLLYLAGWLVGVAVERGFVATGLGRTRALVVGVLSIAVLLYSLLIAGQILLGVLAVLLLVVTAWVTSPAGPLVDR